MPKDSTIQVANGRGRAVVGIRRVEQPEQADRLRALQCNIGQGYLFSRPLPSDEMARLLRERADAGRQRADAA